MTQLDEKALEAADAEAALAAAARLTSNIRDVEDSYVAGADFEASARERQRVRLLDRRRLEAEFQTRCVYLVIWLFPVFSCMMLTGFDSSYELSHRALSSSLRNRCTCSTICRSSNRSSFGYLFEIPVGGLMSLK